jgi:sulfate permease, SulP family
VGAGPDPPPAGVVRRHLPILQWLPGYDRAWLASDAVAGLSVWALLVPQSLAYAVLAGVPVQYGLYTAFAALLAYPLFGTSRQLVEGPSATVAAVSAAVVAPIVGASAMGTSRAVGYTAALALAAGAAYVLLGALRMGWVSTFLSKAVMAGFILGFSIGIIIDQSHKLFGVDIASGTYAQELVSTVKALPDTDLTTLAVGAGSLAVLLVMRYTVPKWPRALIVMALAIVAVDALDLESHGVAVTGHVPTGLFSVGLPGVGFSQTTALVVGALSVVFVGFSESLASSRTMALKWGYEIDPNQELIAQGMANAASGLVGGFVVDGSLSKTSVADTAGQRSQMASLINALFVLLTILLLARLFEKLPSATLGAVVIDAMVGLVTFAGLRRYFRVNRADWVFFMGAGLGILFFGIIQGILTGVVLSLLLLIARSSHTSVRRLGYDRESRSYHAVDRGDGLETIPGLLVARVDGPLFFADADRFRSSIRALVREQGPPTAVVIDADAVHLTDTDGADILIQVARELRAQGADLALAHVHPPVLALWQRAGLSAVVPDDEVFATVREAVDALSPASDPAASAGAGAWPVHDAPAPR